VTLETSPPALNPNTAPLGVDEDDDDYEPDFYAAEDTEQILNKLDTSPSDAKPSDGALQLETFSLPPAPQLSTDAAAEIGKMSIAQLVERMKSLEDPSGKRARPGFNRFASSFGDRDSAVTLLIRLATRSRAGLDGAVPKQEGDDHDHDSSPPVLLSDHIRDILHAYIVDDFRKRIDVAVAWLCEEWLSDRLRTEGGGGPRHYERLVLKLMDGFLPYLHRQDKVLTRFLAEIPELSEAILARVKQICRDPTVVGLALTSLLYIIMMKPPAREMALDTLEAIWAECKFYGSLFSGVFFCLSIWEVSSCFSQRNLGYPCMMLTFMTDEDARPTAEKYLLKFRPGWRKDSGDTAMDSAPPAKEVAT
jgi:symplekin